MKATAMFNASLQDKDNISDIVVQKSNLMDLETFNIIKGYAIEVYKIANIKPKDEIVSC